jgi:hypothetical protein
VLVRDSNRSLGRSPSVAPVGGMIVQLKVSRLVGECGSVALDCFECAARTGGWVGHLTAQLRHDYVSQKGEYLVPNLTIIAAVPGKPPPVVSTMTQEPSALT